MLTPFRVSVEFALPGDGPTLKRNGQHPDSLTVKQVICVGAPVSVAKPLQHESINVSQEIEPAMITLRSLEDALLALTVTF